MESAPVGVILDSSVTVAAERRGHTVGLVMRSVVGTRHVLLEAGGIERKGTLAMSSFCMGMSLLFCGLRPAANCDPGIGDWSGPSS